MFFISQRNKKQHSYLKIEQISDRTCISPGELQIVVEMFVLAQIITEIIQKYCTQKEYRCVLVQKGRPICLNNVKAWVRHVSQHSISYN